MTQERTKSILTLAVIVLVCLLAVSTRAAEAPAGTPAVTPPPAGPEIGTFHNPTDWMEMGADFRFREHYGYNWTGLNNDLKAAGSNASDWHFERYRTRWWTKSTLNEDTAINTRFTWEFRTYDNPEAGELQHTDFDEIIMDNFNLVLKNFLGTAATAKLGRQDIMDLGKGWLVMDGTPLDGSRTFYFDAARFTVALEEKKKLDLIYIRNMPNSDWWLKPINDRDKFVTQQQEQGAILYLTDKSNPTQLEGYFMYKNINPVDGIARNTITTEAKIAQLSKKAEIFTLGGAAGAPLNDNWNYRVEGAVQLGDSSPSYADANTYNTTEDLLAYGLKGDIEYCFKDEVDNKLHTTYEFLSGDNPNSSDVEAFNPLWAQWPQWSELYQPYVTSMEDGLVSNLHRFAFGHKFKPNNKWDVATDYHLLWADENSFRGGSRFSDHGRFRGHLLTCWVKYNFTKQLKGNLIFEHLWPGNYYAEANRDNALYFHFTVEYTF